MTATQFADATRNRLANLHVAEQASCWFEVDIKGPDVPVNAEWIRVHSDCGTQTWSGPLTEWESAVDDARANAASLAALVGL